MITNNPNATVSRKDQERREKRAAIVQAAERVFLRKKYHNAAIDDIAQEAHLSVGSIYNFFENKNELFIEVIKTISLDLLKELQQSAAERQNRERAFEKLIHLRISNFERHKLFLQMFYDKNSNADPDFGKLPQEIVDSYHNYLELLGEYLATVCNLDSQRDFYPVYLALSFEGFISAYMGYEEQANQNETLAKAFFYIKQLFSGQLFAKPKKESLINKKKTAYSMKEIYITQYDLARLTDLILVSRSFSGGFADVHLRNLAREMNRAKIVDSRHIPPDVITMNSKIRLKEMHTEETFIYTLVFPSDENSQEGKISILTPLGTSLIGYRIGDSFEIKQEKETRTYRIDDILYQPESAGNYSL